MSVRQTRKDSYPTGISLDRARPMPQYGGASTGGGNLPGGIELWPQHRRFQEPRAVQVWHAYQCRASGVDSTTIQPTKNNLRPNEETSFNLRTAR